MYKKQLVDMIAEKLGKSKKESAVILDTVIDVIREALANGEDVRILGFGTFTVKERSERRGRNPQTGEQMVIPAHKVPVFKAGSELKKAVAE